MFFRKRVYRYGAACALRVQRTRYAIPPRNTVLDRKYILNNFRARDSVSQKTGGDPRTVRTPENV